MDVAGVPNIVDVTEDQFVLVNLSGKGLATGAYDVVKVSDVEIMSDATVTKFSKASSTKIASKLTVDGEEYSASHKAFYDKDVLDVYDQQLLTDMSYNIYLDQYGYAIGVDLFEGTKNYVFITGYDRGKSYISVKTAQAGAIFLDGRMEEITVNVTDTNKNIDRMDGVVNNACSDPYFELWGATSVTANGKLNENRWYTYTENNGVYTLKPCENMFATNLANGTVIKSAYVYLDDSLSTKGRAYGNDESIYITVEAGHVDESISATAKDAITDVNGLYTGVQNVEIELTADTKQQVPNNIYTLYDNDRYIIASIVLGEAQGSIANYAYILDSAKNEELRSDGFYYWQFDAVVAGEKVTLTAKTKYTSVFSGLRPFHVQELRYDGDYVTAVKDVDDSKIYTNNLQPIAKQDIYDVGHVHTGTNLMDISNGTGCTLGGTRINGDIVLEGRTLYTTNAYGTRDVGLALASDAKAVLIQYEGTSSNYMDNRTVSNCGSVSEAIGRLADRDTNKTGTQFKGRIVAVLNSAGVAQWVVIISDTPLIIGGGSVVNPGGQYDPNVVVTGANSFTVNYYDPAPVMTPSEVNALMIQVMEKYTGLTVKSYSYPVSNVMIFDDGTVFGAQAYVTPNRQVALMLNGTLLGYYNDNTAIPATTLKNLLGNGSYLVNQKAATSADITVVSGSTMDSISAAQMSDDVNIYTAYKISLTAGGNAAGTSYRGVVRYNNTVWPDDSYFAKDTQVQLIGSTPNFTNNSTQSAFRRFEEHLTGTALTEYVVVSGTTAQAANYTVTRDVEIMESTDMVRVIIDGTDYGLLNAYGTGVPFVPAAQDGSTTLTWCRAPKMHTSDGALLSSTTITTSDKITYTYKMRTDHAVNGVIELVRAAQVTGITSAMKMTVNGSAIDVSATTYLVAPGDVLTFASSVSVNGTPLTAGADGTYSYTVGATDTTITLS